MMQDLLTISQKLCCTPNMEKQQWLLCCPVTLPTDQSIWICIPEFPSQKYTWKLQFGVITMISHKDYTNSGF